MDALNAGSVYMLILVFIYRQEFLEYMDSVGYRHIKDAHMGTNEIRQVSCLIIR